MIRRPPRSTLSSSSAASDVYKRQVSTQSTGNRHPSMATIAVVNLLKLDHHTVLAMLVVSTVLAIVSRARIDQTASTFLDVASVRKSNSEWRRVWGSCVLAMCSLSELDRYTNGRPSLWEVDPLIFGFCYLWVPFMLATSSIGVHHKIGWVNLAALYVCIALCSFFPPKGDLRLDQGVRDCLFAVWCLLMVEVYIERLSTLIQNLLGMNLTVLVFQPESFKGIRYVAPLLAVAVALFLWRRRRRVELLPEGGVANHEAGRLVELVLESGDELCEASREMLVQVLQILGHGDAENGLGTKSKLGAGTGVGAVSVPNWTDEDLDCFGVDDADLKELVFGGTGSPLPSLDATLDSPWLSAATSNQTEVAWSRLAEDTTALTSCAGSWLPYVDQMLDMSFDAMAQVELSTGALLWRNQHFNQLLLQAGGGDVAQGQRLLASQFLMDLSRGVRCTEGKASTTTLTSMTQVVQQAGGDRVLWVIRIGDGESASAVNSKQSSPTVSVALHQEMSDSRSESLNKSVVDPEKARTPAPREQQVMTMTDHGTG
eukprot:TRINITY_DN14040_c0_g1_i1.p1 TRINITY_DN14040_c0_g1~~TRINITY_DN14040_c0_g1_i1.p1  ORF type:complete len:543 (+),score=146.65 TRINITY_DN14040_c0_g1_i1:83-1711(+)